MSAFAWNLVHAPRFDLDGTSTDPRLGITRSSSMPWQSCASMSQTRARASSTSSAPPLLQAFMQFYGFGRSQGVEVNFYREAATGLAENLVFAGVPEVLSPEQPGPHAAHRHFKTVGVCPRNCPALRLRPPLRGDHGSELDGTRTNKAFARFAICWTKKGWTRRRR